MPSKQFATPNQVADAAQRDPQLLAALQADPINVLHEVSTPLQSDIWVYRLVVIFLGLAILGSLGIAGVLIANGKEVHALFVATASGAIGALAGLLAPSPAVRS